MPPPTGLTVDQIGVIGHSNVSIFVTGYRLISSKDLIPLLNQGGADAEAWGDPASPSYAAAWNSLANGEPVGGYRALWVMLGFKVAHTNEAINQGWADHVASRIASDYPSLEWVWWSPMNTYFTTNPGDGDAANLVALDPWNTNPQSLTTWKANDNESKFSWNNVVYAQAQGYFDDYGPWINLTDALTDTDNRHPTEPPTAEPTGQTHGGAVLLAFFDAPVVEVSMGGTIRTGTIN